MTPERALEPNRACAERFRRALDGDIIERSGDVAQLGERRVRNAKVEGSIPFVSTKFRLTRSCVPAGFLWPRVERCGAYHFGVPLRRWVICGYQHDCIEIGVAYSAFALSSRSAFLV